MSTIIHKLKPNSGARKKSKRVGRGNASGKGTTAARGTKGQRARTGGRNRLKQKGWRSLLLSAPKLRGFKSFKLRPEAINLDKIQAIFKDGEKINPQTLLEKKLIKKIGPIKILNGGDLKKKLEISGCQVSKLAKQKIEAVGGKVI
ncbi:MAG TPA: 50S ribosomal protein L15 [Candidatus Magasanikbacteria bacterium]|nr:50S ribosomal protein L15 [Candidatus Magasanikbacteria bacterium]